MKIGRTYHFESAHRLPKVPSTHKCHHLHGHNYKVEVVLDGTLDERGFVIDFFELDEAVAPLLAQVDHKFLNDVPGLENPTAENIALWFFEGLRALPISTVKVWETAECWAECGDNWRPGVAR